MSHIKTFARIKPTRQPFEDVDVINGDLLLRIPDSVQYYSTPTKGREKVTHQFQFEKIFDEDVSQEEVFNTVAVDIVDAFLNGYNGTIFAYGQTGTGKTYTVEGGARRYSERGLASRAVSRIYQSLEKRSDEEISVHISFLEIYQEVGFDLLNPAARGSWIVTPFPRVTVMEGPAGSCLIRDLSRHFAASEEVAQNLLLQGQVNRTVAETPVNQRSSRSHAVFTLTLTSRKIDSDIVVKSKLHLVDLAGSERVAKTGVDGQQLSEAKSINLSLHHLESVIIALQSSNTDKQNRLSDWRVYEVNPRHIPYRNSLLTMLLRDSLGGNCLTAMVATISLEWQNLGETISTCRFAQRVACISNSIRRNEEIDDKSLVKILRKKIAELETEIAFLKDGQAPGRESDAVNNKLTDEDKIKCTEVIKDYIIGRINDPISAGITDPYKFRECMKILKRIVKESVDLNKGKIVTDNITKKRPSSGPSKVTHCRSSSRNSQTTNQTIEFSDGNLGSSLKVRCQSMGNLSEKNTANTKSSSKIHRTNSEGAVRSKGGVRNRPQSAQGLQTSHKSPYLSQQRQSKDCQIVEYSPESKAKIHRLLSKAKELKGKEELYESQLHDVRSHIAHLKLTEAEDEVLQREYQLEKVLSKAKASVIGRQEKVYHKLVRISKREGLTSPVNMDVALEEKFGQHRKSDGCLNTKQVLETLHNQESLDCVNDSVNIQDLEKKEEQTRQKLQHFKKLLQGNTNICRSGLVDDKLSSPDVFTSPYQTSTPNRTTAWEMDKPRKKTKTLTSENKTATTVCSPYCNTKDNQEANRRDEREKRGNNSRNINGEEPVWRPSEYVNLIENKDVFDAHQMGLYAKSFESALQSMLEKDNADTFSHQFYEKYARKSTSSSHTPVRRRQKTNIENGKRYDHNLMTRDHHYTPSQLDDRLNIIDGSNLQESPDSIPMMYSGNDLTEKKSVKATPEDEQEMSFMTKAKEQKQRIEKIRKAQWAAGVIQKCWKKYCLSR